MAARQRCRVPGRGGIGDRHRRRHRHLQRRQRRHVEAALARGERFIALFEGNFLDPHRIGTLPQQDIETFSTGATRSTCSGGHRGSGQNLVFGGEAHHVLVSGSTIPFAQNLGVDPHIGRWFTDETGVMISNGLWRRLGSDAAIVGKLLTLDGRSYTVAGVMPPAFRFPVNDVGPTGRPARRVAAAGRRGGCRVFRVCAPEARGDVRGGAGRFAPGRGEIAERRRPRIASLPPPWDLRQTITQDIRPTLLLLLGAAGLLFLITCANGLLLTRAVARARETATRVALAPGAGSWPRSSSWRDCWWRLPAPRVVLLAMALTPAIVAMAVEYLPRADQVSVDWTVLLFAVGAAAAASALSSLAPLWQAMRTAPADALGEGVRASASAKSRRVSRWLVVAEMAFAFGLLTLSAMLILNLRQLTRTATGFDPDGLVTFVVSGPG